MGRKLNTEYRERMAERRQLPVCQHCGRRNRRGDHASCVLLATQGNTPTTDEIIQKGYERIERKFAKDEPPPF